MELLECSEIAFSHITGVWKCVGVHLSQEVCLPCERERSHGHTAKFISKANHLSILPSQAVMSQSE